MKNLYRLFIKDENKNKMKENKKENVLIEMAVGIYDQITQKEDLIESFEKDKNKLVGHLNCLTELMSENELRELYDLRAVYAYSKRKPKEKFIIEIDTRAIDITDFKKNPVLTAWYQGEENVIGKMKEIISTKNSVIFEAVFYNSVDMEVVYKIYNTLSPVLMNAGFDKHKLIAVSLGKYGHNMKVAEL